MTTEQPRPHPELTDGCGWLIQRPNGHPEPTSASDCYDIVECGALVLTIPGNPEGWQCTSGHMYRGIEAEWAMDGYGDRDEYYN